MILARGSKAALVIRRGPSKHVATVAWDRRTDTFQLGQWLYGRIYERRCDLSPDGKRLIYFAMNGRWTSAARGSWTAISRAPYLKAETLYAKGDCWHGGGLFLSSGEYWLNDGFGHVCLHDSAGLSRIGKYPWHEIYGGECPGVYFIRLQRDGWKMGETVRDGRKGHVTVFEKSVKEHWRLRKHARSGDHPVGRSVNFDTHHLLNTKTGMTIDCSAWEWADIDDKRLVWATQGKLFAARLGTHGLFRCEELFDFNPMKFERIKAPY
ncbi:MAG TPA: hypothetical protein VLV87_12090 [Gammaproteobacteria bacterium]|nr:hypothetical protein [Gammaproteobacteria bacterium]